jgi:hypothetical protein
MHILLVLLILLIHNSAACEPAESQPSTGEVFRIRITNTVDGAVEVGRSGDYRPIGKVNRPATDVMPGFAASTYVRDGVVAAIATHGIRIKTGTVDESPRMISLVPLQFATIPSGYGGHVPGNSGIYTDIPAGESIFRTLSPFVGNAVFLEVLDGLRSLARAYRPSIGDVLVIIVRLPQDMPCAVEFENRDGGMVTSVCADGTKAHIATVTRPVTGVGRFDGTSYTGVGAVNTNHPGVLTISTAPAQKGLGELEGQGQESRGGFMIQPSRHAATQPRMNQVMIVAPLQGSTAPLEGAPPLFFGHINLAWSLDDPTHSYRAEVRLGASDWLPMPQVIGKNDDAFTESGLGPVTHIRLLFPVWSRAFVDAEILRAANRITSNHIGSRYR